MQLVISQYIFNTCVQILDGIGIKLYREELNKRLIKITQIKFFIFSLFISNTINLIDNVQPLSRCETYQLLIYMFFIYIYPQHFFICIWHIFVSLLVYIQLKNHTLNYDVINNLSKFSPYKMSKRTSREIQDGQQFKIFA